MIHLVQKVGECIFFGLSTDIKPESPDGFVFIEENTTKVFNRTNNEWIWKIGGTWTPLTDGDVNEPEIIYANGDPIMIFVPE